MRSEALANRFQQFLVRRPRTVRLLHRTGLLRNRVLVDTRGCLTSQQILFGQQLRLLGGDQPLVGPDHQASVGSLLDRYQTEKNRLDSLQAAARRLTPWRTKNIIINLLLGALPGTVGGIVVGCSFLALSALPAALLGTGLACLAVIGLRRILGRGHRTARQLVTSQGLINDLGMKLRDYLQPADKHQALVQGLAAMEKSERNRLFIVFFPNEAAELEEEIAAAQQPAKVIEIQATTVKEMANSSYQLALTDAPTTTSQLIKGAKLIGRGGMAEVYAATEADSSRPVAIKVMSDPGQQERFIQEMVNMRRINSQAGVVKIIAYGNYQGRFFIVEELKTAPTLADYVRQRGPLPARLAAKIILNICATLRPIVKELSITHRDIKPSNVFLDDPENGQTTLADFGLAKGVGDSANLTKSDQGVGTEGYFSPYYTLYNPRGIPAEQLDILIKHDIYALGATLYFLLSGGRTPQSEKGKLLQSVDSPAGLKIIIEDPLFQIVSKMLSRNLQDNFSGDNNSHLLVLAYALENYLEGSSDSQPQTQPVHIAKSLSRVFDPSAVESSAGIFTAAMAGDDPMEATFAKMEAGLAAILSQHEDPRDTDRLFQQARREAQPLPSATAVAESASRVFNLNLDESSALEKKLTGNSDLLALVAKYEATVRRAAELIREKNQQLDVWTGAAVPDFLRYSLPDDEIENGIRQIIYGYREPAEDQVDVWIIALSLIAMQKPPLRDLAYQARRLLDSDQSDE